MSSGQSESNNHGVVTVCVLIAITTWAVGVAVLMPSKTKSYDNREAANTTKSDF